MRSAHSEPRHQVVGKAIHSDGPYGEPAGVLRCSRLEPFDAGFFADVEQHGSRSTRPNPNSKISAAPAHSRASRRRLQVLSANGQLEARAKVNGSRVLDVQDAAWLVVARFRRGVDY